MAHRKSRARNNVVPKAIGRAVRVRKASEDNMSPVADVKNTNTILKCFR